MDAVSDGRQHHWFAIDDQIIDLYGKEIGPIGIAVYAVLARHADKQHRSFPGLKRFQKLYGLSKPTVLKYLRVLQRTGLIAIESRVSTHGDPDSNSYTLLPIPCPGGQIDLPPSQTDCLGVVKLLYRGGKTALPEVSPLKDPQLKEEKDLDLYKNTSLPGTGNVVSLPGLLPAGEGEAAALQEAETKTRKKPVVPISDTDWPTLRTLLEDFGLDVAPLDDNAWWNALSHGINGLSMSFLDRELGKIEAYLIENPRKRPHQNGWKRFVRTWLERAVEFERRHHGRTKV